MESWTLRSLDPLTQQRVFQMLEGHQNMEVKVESLELNPWDGILGLSQAN